VFWLCANCGVENGSAPDLCAMCADDRQWVPASGQQWVTLEELSTQGMRVESGVVEEGLVELHTAPKIGIGQYSKLVCTERGNVLWDPLGYVDADAASAVSSHGDAVAIVASHPHMFGAQVEWSHLLGDVPVYVNAADAEWVMRPDQVIQWWSGSLEVVPSVEIVQVGGHFPGSAVACWRDGAQGRGVLLAGDTIFPNNDGATVGFMRSYPNRIPLSAAVVLRMARTLDALQFDRIYGLLQNVIDSDGKESVRRSAQRHAEWARGDHDDLT
jgi:glyoxylase-like metal-dependent hydrolase (beta-lactamase superfamily II)